MAVSFKIYYKCLVNFINVKGKIENIISAAKGIR